MKIIANINSLTSGFNSEFANVTTVEVQGPIDGGAFGEVYDCQSVNGHDLSAPQIIKVFKDNGAGSAEQGFQTIQKLQHGLVKANSCRVQNGQSLIQTYPALAALPQFSFRGYMDGVEVIGYSANRLDTLGYVPFSQVLDEPQYREEFLTLTIEDRLLLGWQLVQGFEVLSELSFIHGDINPPNLFVHISDCKIAIIDFDSGAVTAHPHDNPTTYGKKSEGGWVAPEVYEQLLAAGTGTPTVKVDRFTDTWAVGIGIHYLLFLCHPLFYLKVLVPHEVGAYLARYKWPSIDPSDPSFEKSVQGNYAAYSDVLRLLPDEVLDKFAATVNQGYNSPALRTSYQQWALILRVSQRPPTIRYFEADSRSLIRGMPVRLFWSVEGAYRVLLDNGIGDVKSEDVLDLFPVDDRAYSLTAYGRHGTITAGPVLVRVWGVPVIQSLMVPAPAVRHTMYLSNIRITAPDVCVSINLDLSIRFDQSKLRDTSDEVYTKARVKGPVVPSSGAQITGWVPQIGMVFDRLKATIVRLSGA